MSLGKDFQQLKQRVAASELASSLKLVAIDGGTVTLSVDRKLDSRKLSCTIFFVSDTDYPNSPLMAMCEDDDAVNSALEPFGDEFEYGAPLLEVISRLCKVLQLDGRALEQLREGSAGASEAEPASEDEYSDNGQDMAETDNQELMEAVLKKVSIWHKLEEDRQKVEDDAAAAEGSQGIKSLSMEEQLAKKRQIFAPQEAYKMLAKELEKLMMEPIDGIAVDAVDNNVWHWDMYLSDFSTATPIAQGLQQLHQEHDKGHVHLQLSFKRGLHPFYPPLLDLLYPRFNGPVAGALTSHPVTQLQQWDPWITQRELAGKLKAFLEAVASVDVSSTTSALEQHQTAAYLPVERQLAKLEALSSMRPLCYAEHKEIYSARDAGIDAQRLEALAPSAKRSKTDAPVPAKRAWAAGVGYGMDRHDSRSSSAWDAKQAEASQAARDAELEELLGHMASGLRDQLGDDANEPSASAAGSSTAAEHAIRRWSGGQASTSGNDSYRSSASVQLCLDAVQGSCLLPFLHRELADASFNDMASRSSYYSTMLSVIWQLCSPSTADILAIPMRPPSEDGRQAGTSGSIHDLMTGLQKSAVRFRQVMGPQTARPPAPPPLAASAGLSTVQGRAAAAAATEAAEEQQSLDLADFILALSDRVKSFRTAESPAGRRGKGRRAEATADADHEHVYLQEMQHLDQVEFDDGVNTGHSYASKVASEGVAPRSRQARIGKELAGLAASLPITLSSSVFVRVDQTHMTLWKALITGPEGTPYSGGCFEFDIYFPPSYPQMPMHVQLRTTGGGTVRFNPNLYNCGKVCLSLLGTWSGAKGETWDASASTTLQMLVSIQSLILVPDPYFNEPGYEGQMHTAQGRASSKAYDRNIREQTLHWAIYQALKSPPPCFKDIVKKHFQLRKDNIIATCTEWIKEARDDSDKRVADRMEQYLRSFRELLK